MKAPYLKPLPRRMLQLVVVLAVALATALAVHHRDDAQETRDVKALLAKYDGLGYSNMLVAYTGHAAISKAIQAGKPGSAKCEADLRASMEYDLLRTCLSQSACAASIVDLVRTDAPELLTNEAPRFKYYRSGEPCTGTN